MEWNFKNEPENREWLSYEDFTRLKTSHSNVGLEDSSVPLFTVTIGEFIETKISPETLCHSPNVVIKLESVKVENIPKSHPQTMQVNVKLEDEDINVDKPSRTHSQFSEVNVVKREDDTRPENYSRTHSQFVDVNVVKREDDIRPENSSRTHSLLSEVNVVKREDDISPENSSRTHSQFVDVNVSFIEDDIKKEYFPQILLRDSCVKLEDGGSQSIGVRDKVKLEDTMTAELSSVTSSLGAQCQERYDSSKEDQSNKAIYEGSVFYDGSGSEVASMVLKTEQENKVVDGCDQVLKDGVHGDIQNKIDVDKSTDNCKNCHETSNHFLNYHDTTLNNLSTNYKRHNQRFDSSEIDDQQCDRKPRNNSNAARLRNRPGIKAGEYPCKCFICGKELPENSCFYRNTSIRTGKKSFTCLTCGKAYIWHTHIHQVIRSRRTVEKKHKCVTCGEPLKQSALLKQYIRIHRVEKPYKCQTCGEAFHYNVCLQNHIRSHTGEQLYQFDTCGKEFAWNKNLNQHNKTHTEDNQYICETCEQAFTQRINLLGHIRQQTSPSCSSSDQHQP